MRLYNHQRNKTKSNKQKNHSSGLWNLISSAGDPEKKNDCIGIPKNSHSGHQPINRTT